VPHSHTSGSLDSITTRYFTDHIGLCYSHNIRYIIIWHVVSKSLYIYTFGDTGITEMDSATNSIYLGDPGVDRHHYTKYTLYLAQLHGAPENDDPVNSGIHSDAVIERGWRYTWSP